MLTQGNAADKLHVIICLIFFFFNYKDEVRQYKSVLLQPQNNSTVVFSFSAIYF